jgi:tetratricopeptide (TPR) repeat protein
MKYVSTCLLLFFWYLTSTAQDLEAINKMKDSLEKAMKQFEKSMNQQAEQMKGFKDLFQGNTNTKNQQHSVVNNNDDLPLPKRNSKLLASIPAKTFTKTELVAYVNNLQSKLVQQKGNAAAIKTAQAGMKKYPVANHHGLALLFFTKKQEVSALFVLCSIIKANPANTLAMNNLAAILNHAGFPHKSIPVSRHVLAQAAQSAMVNNNMGQAYFQLGDIDNAIRFLSATTRIEPFHIEANATQGYINEARGNSAAAANHYSNSLKGGYNKAAAEGMKRTKPSDDISDKLRLPPRMNYPEMDDNLPFACPADPGSSYAAVVGFNAKMQAETDAWNRTHKDYEERSGKDMEQNIMNLIGGNSRGRIAVALNPLFNKAQVVTAKSYRAYTDEGMRIENEYEKWKREFDKEWAAKFKNVCDGLDPDRCCAAETGLYNAKNAAFMNRYHRYCEDVWNNTRWHYNTIAYWYPYVKNVPFGARDLIIARGILLGTASKLTAIHLTEYTCGRQIEKTDSADKKANFKNIDCPASVKIPLGVGDVKLSCESLSVDLGEGIMGGFEYEFGSGQTTMYIGVGVQAEAGVLSVEASATQFISFDSNFNVTDVGNKLSLGASAMEISPTLGLEGMGASGNVVFGVNSGLNVSSSVSAIGQSIFAGEVQLL